MADYTLTSSNVVPGPSAVIISGFAASAISAGQTVFEDPTSLDIAGRAEFRPYDADAASPHTAGVRGIAANTAAANQPVDVVIYDPAFTHGLTGVTKGDIMIASATAGGIAPVADLASGMRPAVVMIATSATVAVLQIAQNTTAK